MDFTNEAGSAKKSPAPGHAWTTLGRSGASCPHLAQGMRYDEVNMLLISLQNNG